MPGFGAIPDENSLATFIALPEKAPPKKSSRTSTSEQICSKPRSDNAIALLVWPVDGRHHGHRLSTRACYTPRVLLIDNNQLDEVGEVETLLDEAQQAAEISFHSAPTFCSAAMPRRRVVRSGHNSFHESFQSAS